MDCNDQNANMNPGLAEICGDGIDNNCNGFTDEDCRKKICPSRKALGENNPNLEYLRAFRDNTLSRSAIGQKIIQIYYNNGDSINAALDRSPALRAVARKVLEVIAPIVGRTEE
jgi:hypothetical protein